MVKVIVIARDGNPRELDAPENSSLLRAVQAAGLDMEGACEGSMACSTCHVIVSADWADKLPPASAPEEDMLDLTYGVTRTSRLACQIVLKSELEGLTVKLPPAIRNMMG